MSKDIKESFDILELTKSFLTGNTNDVVDIITFMEAPWGLNFKPRPVQKFILRCFYGLPLNDTDKYIPVPDVCNEKILYKFTEVEFLDYLCKEGRCNTNEVTGKNFKELDLVLGRRSGKSVLTSTISAYELYKLVKRGNPLEYYGFPPHEKICILNVAPSDEQAKIIFDQTMKLALACPYIQPRVVSPTQETFNVLTDHDLSKSGKKNQGTINILSGGCSSNSLRGQNSILTAMDESAFFLDNGGRFSGKEVYKALTPSTSTFKSPEGLGQGKIVCISSPYAKYGMFFERWQQSFDEPDTTLMFQMYSSMVNPEIVSSDLKTARRRDKNNFTCEFGAEFTDSVSAWIDDEIQFRECVKDNIQISSQGRVGITYFMAIDLGLKNDGTAIAITHKDSETGKIVLDYVSLWYSKSSDVWDLDNSIYHSCNKFADKDLIKVDAVAKEIQELVKWFPTKSGFFDQNNGYGLMEKLHDAGLKQFVMTPVSETSNHEAYQVFKTLYQDNQVVLPNHPIYIPELLSLQAEKMGKSKIRVAAPNKKGSHDDVSDAITYAIYECFKNYHDSPAKITSMIGNGNGKSILSGGDANNSNMAMFHMNKIMKHGMNPRNVKYGQQKGVYRGR